MSEYLPRQYTKFLETYPDVAEAHGALGQACHEAGPLDASVRHLIKLGIATAARSEGAVKAHTRQALGAGANAEEVRHAVLLAMTTSGFPGVIAALGWVDEVVTARSGS